MKTATRILVTVEHDESQSPDGITEMMLWRLCNHANWAGRSISKMDVHLQSSQRIYPPDTEEYKKWRQELSEIATREYRDPFGQDPTSKGDEDHYREAFYSGKTPTQALR